jgi:hypothetical protein
MRYLQSVSWISQSLRICLGEKLTPAKYTTIHQEAYKLSNSQNVEDLKLLHQEIVSKVQSFVHQSILLPFQQSSENISALGLEDISSLESLLASHWSVVQEIDRFTKRIFNGRKWFLENHSDLLICASVYYKQQITSLSNFAVLRKSLHNSSLLEVTQLFKVNSYFSLCFHFSTM